jgi:hypothetical protein
MFSCLCMLWLTIWCISISIYIYKQYNTYTIYTIYIYIYIWQCSMCAMLTNIYPKTYPNVGKYSVDGAYGYIYIFMNYIWIQLTNFHDLGCVWNWGTPTRPMSIRKMIINRWMLRHDIFRQKIHIWTPRVASECMNSLALIMVPHIYISKYVASSRTKAWFLGGLYMNRAW